MQEKELTVSLNGPARPTLSVRNVETPNYRGIHTGFYWRHTFHQKSHSEDIDMFLIDINVNRTLWVLSENWEDAVNTERLNLLC